MTQQIQSAPIEVQIQEILENIVATKEKIEGNKMVLKGYKIKSDKLDELKRKKKELAEMINEETERIENELYEDSDYEQAKNESLTLKNQLKEQKAILGVAVKQKHSIPGLQSEDILTKGGQYKLQLEFSPNFYLDGKLV